MSPRSWHHDPELASKMNTDLLESRDMDTRNGRAFRVTLNFRDWKGHRYSWVYIKHKRANAWTFQGERAR